MNIIGRAFTSIKRNIGKVILLFLLIVILGSVISGAISANQASEVAQHNLRSNMLPVAMVKVDHEHFWEIYNKTGEVPEGRITIEILREIGSLPYVRNFDYSILFDMFAPSLERYEPVIDEVEGWITSSWDNVTRGEPFRLKGTQNPKILEIEEGIIELVNGRVFTPDEINRVSNVAIISEELAQLNNLMIGSVLTVSNVVVTPGTSGTVEEVYAEENIIKEQFYDLEVIGIFKPTIILNPNDQWADFNILRDLQNRIYTPNSFTELVAYFTFEGVNEFLANYLESWDGESLIFENWIQYDNLFTLYDPTYLPMFISAVTKIIPEHYHVMDTSDTFRDAAHSLESMLQLTSRILWLTIGGTVLILTLLIMLFLRDRQREIGIYLALGEKKGKIISQIVLEIMVVAFLAIILALFIGNLISNNISQTMLMNDLVAQQDNNMWRWDPFADRGFRNTVSSECIIESYNVSLTPETIIMFLIVGLGTTFLATIVPTIYIIRMNPKRIMM